MLMLVFKNSIIVVFDRRKPVRRGKGLIIMIRDMVWSYFVINLQTLLSSEARVTEKQR